MLDGFKKFIARGNMIDMAVGVVMGGAVTAVVNAIVDGVINPFIAMIVGEPNMDHVLAITWRNSTVSFGTVIGAIINFILIAVAVYFCIVVPINKFRDLAEKTMAKALADKNKEVAEAEPKLSPEEQTVILLQEIRDQLAAQQAQQTQPSATSAPSAPSTTAVTES